MGINKVTYHGKTLIDLTQDSVTPASLAKGATAHDKAGELIVGTKVDGDLVLVSKTIINNGTYHAGGDNADGYYEVTVNVERGRDIASLSIREVK
jgi:hypothetical protein